MESQKKSMFSTRLHSPSWKRISAHSVYTEYIIQHASSLVGRQLKTIRQLFVFAAYNLVSLDLFSVWKAIWELTTLLWMPQMMDPGRTVTERTTDRFRVKKRTGQDITVNKRTIQPRKPTWKGNHVLCDYNTPDTWVLYILHHSPSHLGKYHMPPAPITTISQREMDVFLTHFSLPSCPYGAYSQNYDKGIFKADIASAGGMEMFQPNV